jgi:minor extracellular serine protease Vpr
MIKKIYFPFLLIFLLSFSLETFGQASLNLGAKRFIKELNELEKSGRSPAKAMVEQYDLIPSADGKELMVGLSAIVDLEQFNDASLESMGIKNDTRLNDLWTFRVPVSKLEDFLQLQGLKYAEIAETIEPDLVRCIVDTRTDSVNRGLNLPRAFTGKDVIIAIIDWGFDYTHPVFYDSTLTDLRISRAWDQNRLSGPAPAGFSFGTEFVGQEALEAVGGDTLYVFGPGSHGTHVAGIGGGNGGGTQHRGAAPEAELIFISLRRDGPSFVDAINYVSQYAESVNKPFVVNMSFGSHLGPHDGSSLKNYGMEQLNGPGQIFVGSAGNNGNQQFHLDYNFNQTPGDSIYTVVDFAGGAEIFGQTVSMWGSPFSEFSVSLLIANQNNEILYESPMYHTSEEISVDITHQDENVNIQFLFDSDFGHFLNDKPSMRWQIRNVPPILKAVLKITSEDSHIHMWNCQRHNDRYTNWGRPFKDNYPGAIEGDGLYAVGEPAGTGKNVITVGSYQSSIILPNGNIVSGALSNFTSSGPSVDERIKPDIASTGEGVISSVSSFDPSFSNYSTTVQHNGKTYGFVSFSGTSMSAPMVSGIVALMLEANPMLTSAEVKQILLETARLDNNTGQLPAEGHLRWGHGKANALAAVQAVLGISNTNEIVLDNAILKVFPNPASDQIEIALQEPMESIMEISIWDLEGRLLHTVSNIQSYGGYRLDLSDLSNGMYLLQCKTEKSIGFHKIVVAR